MILHGDCLEKLKELPDESVDMVLADLPYGTTACKWDVVIPFEPLWQELMRVTKPKAALCFFGSEPFSSALRMSNIKLFRYDWVWRKPKGTGHLNAKKMPLRAHELISVFYRELPAYRPQGTKAGIFNNDRPAKGRGRGGEIFGAQRRHAPATVGNYPKTVLEFPTDSYGRNALHPTQKPIALLEYLIRTYTNPGDTVLDPTMGSGSTGVAAQNTGRKFIGIEKERKYFDIAKRRIEAAASAQEMRRDYDVSALQERA